MTKKVLFITDPMKELKPSKDTSIFMMEEAISLGYKVYQAEMKHLYVDEGYVYVDARNIIEIGVSQVEGIRKERIQVSEFLYTFMRKDPPVDIDYVNALHLLGLAETQGANIFNKPNSIKEFNENSDLSMDYQKLAVSIMFGIMVIGGVFVGGSVIFGVLAKGGCAATVSFFSLASAGIAGIVMAVLGGIMIGIFSYFGLLIAPDIFLLIAPDIFLMAKKDIGKEWQNRERTTIGHKATVIKNWLTERWKGILILIGIMLAIAFAAWLLGYAAWLIAC